MTKNQSILSGLVAIVILLTATSAALSQTAELTYSRDIAPIIQQNCLTCHRPGQMGPMSLQTFEEVRPWAPVIKSKVVDRVMPPWHLDKTVGIQEFENDVSLTDAEIDIIANWVDAGAPRGNPEDLPTPVNWPSDELWTMAERYGRGSSEIASMVVMSTAISFATLPLLLLVVL